MPATRIPLATYRLQFNQDFTFRDACHILEYLADLGITDVYASPILTSRRGSGHGYDVTNPNRIDPDLGSEEDFDRFQHELRQRGMGLLLDIVPNHMAASSENPWWMDVLEHGSESAFASYFDIDWHPPSPNLDGKILLPVLGRPFGEALESGDFQLSFHDGKFAIQYLESSFPLAPKTYSRILCHRLDMLAKCVGADSQPHQEYQGIIAALSGLSDREGAATQAASERRLRFEAITERLRQLTGASEPLARFVYDNLKDFNGTPQDPGSFSNLERLLNEQHYILAHWQNVNETINYRRFFTITDLVGMRVEDSVVFDATHNLIFRLISSGIIAGLRIDHIDGLRDPPSYLKRLQDRLAAEANGAQAYVVVEKILARHECLPSEWPVSGTTGYDYLNIANRVFVHPDGLRLIERTYCAFTGKEWKFADVIYDKKKLVMATLLGVEMRSLGRQLGELAGQARYARELPRHELSEALIETTACFSVYRTYIRNLDVPPEAKESLENALAAASERRRHLNPLCFEFLREVLLLLNLPHILPDQREARLAFVLRWQQFTGPIVAKGMEDTALYTYYPLLSLNEVGGDPQPYGIAQDEFFQFLIQRQARWPHSFNASSTHDTKRSEDNRARISVIAEMPDDWELHLKQWADLNAKYKAEIDGLSIPDRNEEYLLYQTLIGAWPLNDQPDELLVARLQSHVVKATRESMIHTRWTRPNRRHEERLTAFVADILDETRNGAFLEDFRSFHQTIAYYGMLNSLSQTLLKVAAPGVPDFYQGSELWDLRLVDPDNRGPVDFGSRLEALGRLKQCDDSECIEFVAELLANWKDGRIKLYLIWKALSFRRRFDALFFFGEFQRLPVAGDRSENVIAFARRHKDDWAVAVAPRWLARTKWADRETLWRDTSIALPPHAPIRWRNIFTGENLESAGQGKQHLLPIASLLRHFPVTLLSAIPD